MPEWPYWSLASAAIFKSLGDNITAIELYDSKSKYWMSIALDHVHVLTPGTHIFIRRFGVINCVNLDPMISRFMEKPMHMRKNIQGERDQVRSNLAKHRQPSRCALKRRFEDEDDGDDDVEIISFNLLSTSKPTKIKEEPIDNNLHQPRRPHLAPLTIPTATPSTPTPSSLSASSSFSFSQGPSRTLTPITPLSPSLSISSNPPSPTLSTSLLALTGKWPANMYVCEMQEGFTAMDALRGLTVQEKFQIAFAGHPWHQSTYFDSRRRWNESTAVQ